MSADPRDWKLGLLFAAEALDSVGLTLQAEFVRNCKTPEEGINESEDAYRCCVSVAMAAHHCGSLVRAECPADAQRWRQEQRREWEFGMSLLASKMGLPSIVCGQARELCALARASQFAAQPEAQ